jgi:methyl-accepting chemotaxis protein
MVEQTRAIKDMTAAAQNISKQVALITRANRENSRTATSVLESLQDIRKVTARNSEGAKDTLRGTRNLLDTVESLAADMNDLAGNARKVSNANGSTRRKSRSNGA